MIGFIKQKARLDPDRRVEVAQKSGRKKRQVVLELKATSVTFSPSERRAKDRKLKPITVNVVIAKEQNRDKGVYTI